MSIRPIPARRSPAWRLALVLLFGAMPAVSLDHIYLVRHAEKLDGWPAERELDAFQPLSPTGAARAEALAALLKNAGIAAGYTSRTTRTLQTALPLAKAAGVSLTADDATIRPDEMAAFLARLRERHALDRAVLIVGHSNTIPNLLVRLGAEPGCFSRLGITGQPGSLLTEGFEGVWKVDLKKQGCEAIERDALKSP